MQLHAFPMHCRGFTLAELLITLAILGTISSFTIPKVLQSQQNTEYKSIAKESAGMVSSAYSAYKLQNSADTTTKLGDITPFLNYVSVDTASQIDDRQTASAITIQCTAARVCLHLHNGSVLLYKSPAFNGTASTNGVEFYVDPDGVVTDGTTNGPGKTLHFILYYNGRLATRGTLEPNTLVGGFTYTTPDPAFDPPWFNWD